MPLSPKTSNMCVLLKNILNFQLTVQRIAPRTLLLRLISYRVIHLIYIAMILGFPNSILLFVFEMALPCISHFFCLTLFILHDRYFNMIQALLFINKLSFDKFTYNNTHFALSESMLDSYSKYDKNISIH